MSIKHNTAAVSQELMYRLYYRWRKSKRVALRRDALKAKTYGIIYWDRAMFPRERK